jgi:hypothetical protein
MVASKSISGSISSEIHHYLQLGEILQQLVQLAVNILKENWWSARF